MLWQPPQLWTQLAKLIVLSTDVRLVRKATAVAVRTFNQTHPLSRSITIWLTYIISSANALADGTTTISTPLARCATPGAATTAATPCRRCPSDLASELPMPQLRMINNLQTADNCTTICTFFRNLDFMEGRDFFFIRQRQQNSHSTRAKGVLF